MKVTKVYNSGTVDITYTSCTTANTPELSLLTNLAICGPHHNLLSSKKTAESTISSC